MAWGNNMKDIVEQVNEDFAKKGRRDPARIDRILEKLGREWKKYPDMRLGQLYENLRIVYDGPLDPFYWEDDDLEKALDIGGGLQK
jgi:hypothetical protein